METETQVEQIFALLESVYEKSPWSKKFIKEDMSSESSHYFLAAEGKRLIGFLSVQEMMGELEITNLAVYTQNQKKGIASQLLENLSDFRGTIFLEVRESNLPAQNLYEKWGFEKYHTRKKYYTNPLEDAFLMRKIQ